MRLCFIDVIELPKCLCTARFDVSKEQTATALVISGEFQGIIAMSPITIDWHQRW